MRKIAKLVAATAALALVAAGTSGCMTRQSSDKAEKLDETGQGDGSSGVEAFFNKDLKRAEEIFLAQVRRSPDNPYSQFNLADTYLAQGRNDEAIALYRKVTVTGHNVVPAKLYEPHKDGATLQDAACDHLKLLNVTDEHCPN